MKDNVEERYAPEAEATNEEHTKKGDRMIDDWEKDNNDEYKYNSSDWNIANEMDEESIETLVHPAGNVAPFSHKNDYMGYKLNPIEYEEATLGLQATEDRKVIRGNDERKDSPEDRETNKDKHI